MKALYTVAILLLLTASVAHPQSLDIDELIVSEDSLTASTRRYYLRKMESEMTEFSYREKGKWLKYMPRLGFSLIRFFPIADYDTRLLYEAKNDRVRKNAKLQSIQQKNELAFQKTVNSLKSLYRLLQAKINYYNASLTVDKLKTQHLAIIEQQYQNAEIRPTQYLQAKVSSEERKIDRLREYNAILELTHQLIELAQTEETPALLTDTTP